METKISFKSAGELHFDSENPRLVEYNMGSNKSERDIIKILWHQMNVEEIVMSILANGFYEYEPMYGVIEGKKIIIIEGNRRLAAVKAILTPSIIGGSMDKYTPKITSEIQKQLSSHLPVIIQKNRKDAWRYIGFKHVNGAAKWDSYAKAKYIADVHNKFGISLEDIAEQIGDKNNIVKKYYQGLMILKEADEKTDFKLDDTYNDRIFFSHLYTAIGYENYRSFIGFNIDNVSENPIPEDKLNNLYEIMIWIFGSKSGNIPPVIQSQNPDLRNLGQVLYNKEALEILRSRSDLSIAFDASQDGNDSFMKAITEASLSIQKALSKISYYPGDKNTLAMAGRLANSTDSLYEQMKSKYDKENNIVKEPRVTD